MLVSTYTFSWLSVAQVMVSARVARARGRRRMRIVRWVVGSVRGLGGIFGGGVGLVLLGGSG